MPSFQIGGSPGDTGNYKADDITTDAVANTVNAVTFNKVFSNLNFWNDTNENLLLRFPNGSSNDFFTLKAGDIVQFRLSTTGFDHKSPEPSLAFRYLVIE